VLGSIGLRKAKEHPEARGEAPAWVGIIAGGIFGILNIAFLIFAVIVMAMAGTHRQEFPASGADLRRLQ
jgi:hypothetical protein